MPKKAGGARAPKNYDPRYGDRKKAAKSGIGKNHRGYKAQEEAPAKARWTNDDRAGRDTARGIQDRANGRGDRFEPRDRDARFERRERGDMRDNGGDRRGGERGFGGERGERNNDRSFQRGERGGFNRGSGERGGFNRDERSGERGGYRNERSNDRGGFRNDRSGERGGFRNDRSNDRGFNRDDRQRGEGRYDRERPVFRDGQRRFNDDRGNNRGFERRDDNRGFERRDDNRGGFERRDSRPNFRDERPARRDDRGGFERRERPAFRDDNRGERGFERRERPSFRDERPARDERPRGNRADWTGKNDTKKSFEQQEDIVRERLDAKTVSADDVSETTFGDLGLGQNIVRVLSEMGAEKPFPIQAATIPDTLAGRDTLGRGRTGSGKTIAFGAPLVEALLRSKANTKREFGRNPSAIILAPTRELALQIDRTVQPIARSVGLFTTQIYGGVPQARQVGALKKGVDIIIGTPGRIEDLINQGKLDLSDVQFAVLDEADHMCELGFLEPVQRILRETAEGSQKLLFSATLDAEVEALVNEFLVDPAVYEVAGEDQNSGTIEHRVLVIEHRDKADILSTLVDREGKTLVFTRTRAYAEMLTEQFEDAGIPAVALHGDLNQAKRTRNLQRMSSGRVDVLVATDVAARGIHVDDIDLVIQADAPDEYKTYMHRAGRTGRAGNAGRVVTLIPRQRRRRMEELLERADIEAPFEEARIGDDIIEEIAGTTPTLADLTA